MTGLPSVIGVFSDSYGDLDAFEAAYTLLKEKGARRFFFCGGRYPDLDAWIALRSEKLRGGRAYEDQDFLADVTLYLTASASVPRPPAFGEAEADTELEESWVKVRERFVRVPEKESLHYMDPGIPRKVVDMLGETLCCIVHDKNDLDREDLLNGAVFIHGKDSEPKVVQIGPRYFITPGKLTGAAEQTVGLIEVLEREKALRFSAFTLQGRAVMDAQLCPLDKRTKLSVK